MHTDRLAERFEEVTVDLFQFTDLFRDGQNVLAIHALNDAVDSTDFLITPQLTVRTSDEIQSDAPRFYSHPTPGEPNGLGSTTSLLDATHEPNVPQAGEDLVVTATVLSTTGDLPTVNLVYRVMFGDEIIVPMRDDGLSGDGAAGDGVFGATIPATADAGQMIRYRITAGESETDSSRLPRFIDELNRQQYFGTVVEDPSIQSNLRVMHLFLEDPAGADTLDGARGSLFHDGKFYDNIDIDVSGRTVGLAGPKKESRRVLSVGELVRDRSRRECLQDERLRCH